MDGFIGDEVGPGFFLVPVDSANEHRPNLCPPPRRAHGDALSEKSTSGERRAFMDNAPQARDLVIEAPMLPLTRADALTAAERREYPRLPLGLWAHCQIDGMVSQEALGDLSVGGLYLRTSNPAPMGARVRIVLGLPYIGGQRVCSLAGRVVWVDRNSAQIKGLGVQFDEETGNADAQLLRGFLALWGCQRRPTRHRTVVRVNRRQVTSGGGYRSVISVSTRPALAGGNDMLARCTHCESTFVTQHFGRQRCPKCSVEVFVEDPPEPRGRSAAPKRGKRLRALLDLTPWECRAELGTLPALGKTISAAVGRPGPFSSGCGTIRMTAGSPISRAHRAAAHSRQRCDLVVHEPNPADMKDIASQLKSTGLFEQYPEFNQYIEQAIHHAEFNATGRGLAVTLVSGAAFTMLGLFIAAGVVHGILALFRKAGGSWPATLKATVYAATPLIFFVIPACGELIAFTWATGLQIYALSKAHRISGGHGHRGCPRAPCGPRWQHTIMMAALALAAARH